MKTNRNERWTGRGRRRRAAMMLALTASWMLLGTGCTSRVVKIPADRWVTTVPAGTVFRAEANGKFVPDARFNELLDAYIRMGFK